VERGGGEEGRREGNVYMWMEGRRTIVM